MTGTGRYDRSMVPRRALLMPALTAMTAFLVVSGAESQIVRDPRRLESGVDLVMVTATVLDAEGHLVTNLPRDAFGIREDGLEQTISVFSSERVPVGLGVLLDASDSMFGQRIIDARA